MVHSNEKVIKLEAKTLIIPHHEQQRQHLSFFIVTYMESIMTDKRTEFK